MKSAFTDNDGKPDWRKIGYHARSAFAVILSITILVGGGWFIYAKANNAWTEWRTAEDYIGEGGSPVHVEIPKGATITQMGDILVEKGVIKSTKKFRHEAAENPESEQIQPGRYNLKTELPAKTALEMLLDLDNLDVVKLTFPEGMTLEQQWDVVKKHTGIERKEMASAVEEKDLDLPKWSDGKREGFMFPDTYQVLEPVKPADIVKAQVAQFNKVADSLKIETAAEELGMSPYDIITVASIIEREVGKEEYRPLVARAIYNRLDQDMELQVDSSVHYALNKFDKVTTTKKDRETDSPYNTYLHKGLPPGAIGNPGKDAIQAALNPAEGDWLYWTTIDLDSGKTVFADDIEGHEKNVKKFQKWCQDNEGRC